MRRILTRVAALVAAVAVMGAGGQSRTAPARAVVTAYYADLASGHYAKGCTLLAPAYIRLAGEALLASKHDRADADAAIHGPTAAACGRVLVDVIKLEKVNVAASRAVTITSARLRGKVATVELAKVPGAGGSTIHLAAIVTDVRGAWIITSFANP